jgi:CRISPR/Cas system-associated protein Cas10 (large subunit of type III CRISPR-Cas system)
MQRECLICGKPLDETGHESVMKRGPFSPEEKVVYLCDKHYEEYRRSRKREHG